MKRLLLISIIIGIFSCTKQEDLLISGNTAPPDFTIENVLVEGYINKLYISVLGREATQSEFDDAFAALTSAQLSQSSRTALIDQVFSNSEYADNEFKIASSKLVGGQDTTDISDTYFTLNFLLLTAQTAIDSTYIMYEIDRMQPFASAYDDFLSGSIELVELHSIMVNNFMYDQINMGTENFVISIFQNFLGRYPTIAELESGKAMVDGFNAVLFLQAGNGKDGFLDIFFNSNNYFAGEVISNFNRFLYRNPTAEELSAYAKDYQDNLDYQALQRIILSSDEFIGL